MSRSIDRHEGVSCDGCHTDNFRCPRYKCLVCFDYDLCAHCFEAGTATQRHTPDHSMQCILTREDHELYYGGGDQPQSFACPFCRNLGFTETSLQEHVTTEHSDVTGEVVCPVCAATPSGEPNHMTDDLANHLLVDHLRRNEFSHEESRLQRRVPPPPLSRGAGGVSGAIISRGRGRGHNAAAAAGLSAFAREASDPIAELLSQLGGIRRAGASAVSQIQQLQQQVSRQAPRRTIITTIEAGGGGVPAGGASTASAVPPEPATFVGQGNLAAAALSEDLSRLLLPTLFERNLSEEEKVTLDVERANRSLFVQELLLSTIMRPPKERSKHRGEDGASKKDVVDNAHKSDAGGASRNRPQGSRDSSASGRDAAAANGTTGKIVVLNGPHYAQNGASSNSNNVANDSAVGNVAEASVTSIVHGGTDVQTAQAAGTVQNTAPSIRVTATTQRHPGQQQNSTQPQSRASPATGATSTGQM